MFTFIKICIVLGVLGKGETVGDLQPIIDDQAQEDALDHLTSLALFLIMLDNFQHHLQKHRKVGGRERFDVTNSACSSIRRPSSLLINSIQLIPFVFLDNAKSWKTTDDVRKNTIKKKLPCFEDNNRKQTSKH